MNDYRPLGMDGGAWFKGELLERFGRYVAVSTASDHHGTPNPSTPGQWDLARLLEGELRGLGLADVTLTEHCYLYARLPGNLPAGARAPAVAFLAHLDTSPDCSGAGVRLLVHPDYDGGAIELPSGERLDPERFPDLRGHVGKTILTSDGTTLLGADDKAGVAEIMAAAAWLAGHPEIRHGDVEIVFTPDEEIGHGVDRLPRELLRAGYCYTLDGDEEGSYNDQCFNGWTVDATFKGRMIHPGEARGRLVNPVVMAATFVTMIPRTESPEATDGDYGFYCPQEISGSMEEVRFTVFIRDFDLAQVERRLAYLRQLAATVEAAFPGGSVVLGERRQYLNMRQGIEKAPRGVELLRRAIADTGMEPVQRSIRGGTDGARLTEMGIPTPNIFAGGHNFHSRHEWVPLESMVRASLVVVNLAQLWALG